MIELFVMGEKFLLEADDLSTEQPKSVVTPCGKNEDAEGRPTDFATEKLNGTDLLQLDEHSLQELAQLQSWQEKTEMNTLNGDFNTEFSNNYYE